MDLLVFEGIDGCGKTFLCKKLAKQNNWVYLKTPPSKGKCRTEEEELSRYEKGLLLNAKTIKEELSKGKTVICDRYFGTYLVDCALLGVKPKLSGKELPLPTKTIHLVASWKTIKKRLKKKRNLSSLEKKLINDEKVYNLVLSEFRKLGYEEMENEG